MTDTQDDDTEFEVVADVLIPDGACWVADPDLLAHDSGAEGVLAVQYMEGGLYYFDGATRKWLNVEAADPGKTARKLRPVN